MEYIGIAKVIVEGNTEQECIDLLKKLKDFCDSTGELGHEKIWVKDSDIVGRLTPSIEKEKMK